MDRSFHIDPAEFQSRKRRRISTLQSVAPPLPKVAPTSAPGIHEIATFLPGRLEFEHEVDNDAEDLVKDLEFGVCLEWGGADCCIEDEADGDVKGRAKLIEEKKSLSAYSASGMSLGTGGRDVSEAKSPAPMNGINGHSGMNGDSFKPEKAEDVGTENGTKFSGAKSAAAAAASEEADPNADEITQPPPIESKDSLAFKLTLMEMYAQRVEKRLEAKSIMFQRGLLEYKKVCICSSLWVNLQSDALSRTRCKQQRRKDQRMKKTSYIGYGPSRDLGPQMTMKSSPQICCVSLLDCLRNSGHSHSIMHRRINASEESSGAAVLSSYGPDYCG